MALGIAMRRLAAHEAAVESLSRAVALAPKNAQAWFNLGLAYRASGNSARCARARYPGATRRSARARLRSESEKSTAGEINQ